MINVERMVEGDNKQRQTETERNLCIDCHAKEIGKAPVTRAIGQTAPSLIHAPPLPPVPESDASHERLLLLSSRIDPLPQLQSIPMDTED